MYRFFYCWLLSQRHNVFFIFLVNLNNPGKNFNVKSCTKFTKFIEQSKVQLFRWGRKNLRNLSHGFENYLVKVKTMRKIVHFFVVFSKKLKFTIKSFSTFDYFVYLYFLRGSKNGKKWKSHYGKLYQILERLFVLWIARN